MHITGQMDVLILNDAFLLIQVFPTMYDIFKPCLSNYDNSLAPLFSVDKFIPSLKEFYFVKNVRSLGV